MKKLLYISLISVLFSCNTKTRAVTLHPTLKNYKTLAAFLEKNKNYTELNDLYFLLTNEATKKENDTYESYYIFGKPNEDLYYEFLATQLLTNRYLSGYDIYRAKDMGMNISSLKTRLFNDPRIKIDMSTEEAKKMMLLFLSDSELASYIKLESTFKDYLSSIKDIAPVFEITLDNVNAFQYDDFNGVRDYDEGIDESTVSTVGIYRKYLQESISNPDSWIAYNLNHFMDINDRVKAVVYAIDSSETACPINMRHIYHRLVTYDNKTNILDSKIVAYQLGEKAATASFNGNKISVTEYNRTWKKPYKKLEFNNDFDNDLLSVEKMKTINYEINDDGKIAEIPN